MNGSRLSMGDKMTAKGGVFAPADINLIKRALLVFVHNESLSTAEERQVVNLLHRLNRL